MPGRYIFFSFSYEQDIWRAANVRKAGEFHASARAGWTDASIWEEAKRKGKAEIERMIAAGLKGTSVTVVLIGANTASRPWVNYEIEKSIERGNGLLGVRIHGIRDQNGTRSQRGDIPKALTSGGYRVHDWNSRDFRRWVELAAIAAGKLCLAQRENCFVCKWLR